MAIATLTDWHRPKGIKRAIAKRRSITVGGVMAILGDDPRFSFDLRDDHPGGTEKYLRVEFTEDEAKRHLDALAKALGVVWFTPQQEK